MVSRAWVVTAQLALTPPTVTVAVWGVLKSPALVRSTASVWPGARLPLVTQGPPWMLTCGLPSPLTVTGAAAPRPVRVTVLEVIALLRATST